jgi:hypothetical protein
MEAGRLINLHICWTVYGQRGLRVFAENDTYNFNDYLQFILYIS